MPRRAKDNSETPDRVTISTKLTKHRIDNYWRVLNMDESTWKHGLSPSQRYELALNDILSKLQQVEGVLDKLDLE